MTRLFDSVSEKKTDSTEPNNVASSEDALSSQAIALLKAELSAVKANAIKESKETDATKETKDLSPKDSKTIGEGTKNVSLIKHFDEPSSKIFSPFSELSHKHGFALAIETPLTTGLAVGSFLMKNSSPLASRALMLSALFVGADALYRTAGTMQGMKVGSVYGDAIKDVAMDFRSLVGWKLLENNK